MTVSLSKSALINDAKVSITGSKSESNRLLLLKALYPEIEISNLSNSDDSQLMTRALQSDSNLKDIHHAGTAMRFLTAYYAIQSGKEIVLTGSKRMKERPIKVLVDALNAIGASIDYVENEGYPPLRIAGSNNLKESVSIKANVSSQYISALLLIAAKLPKGLTLTLEGTVTSIPYIKMTLSLLEQVGIKYAFENNVIRIEPLKSLQKSRELVVESDWSSASYFYSLIALSKVGTKIFLSSYKENSLQGDSVLAKLYRNFGVETTFIDHSIVLEKVTVPRRLSVQFDLIEAPDIAQTIAVTSAGLGMGCTLTGLHTLKIKETDRLVALKNELKKFGADISVTDDTLYLQPCQALESNVSVSTYNDHRMAMAFAPLALVTDLKIDDADVVSKSYPDFWQDLIKIGVAVTES